jgi:DNA-binding protein H-NS
MKVSKKEIAKFQKKEQKQIAGREVNRVEDLTAKQQISRKMTQEIQAARAASPAYYEADGGSMWNGVGRSYF